MTTILHTESLEVENSAVSLEQRRSDARSRLHAAVPVLVVITVSVVLAIPAIRFGLPFGHDAVEHLSWYRCFAAQLWSGEAYPHWLQGMNSGLGSPDLFVYGPLPYYAAALFRLFSLGPARELGMSVWVALCLSGLAVYLWLREVVGDSLSATVAAMLYMVAPYHLKTDLYTRSALAEFWAFVWMPLTLYFSRRLVNNRTSSALAGLAVAYACLLGTHLFTALIFSPIPLIYAAILTKQRDERFQLLIKVGIGLMLGAALSAVYLLPALACQKYISPYKLIESHPELYIFDHFFLFSKAMSSNPFIKTLSWLTAWTALVAVGAFAVAYQIKNRALRRESIFWLIVAAVSVGMMLPASSVIWRMIPQLRAIQFPWRFNTALVLSTAVLAGLAVATLVKNRARKTIAIAICTLCLVGGWIVPIWRSMANQHRWVKENEPYSQDYLITAWAQWTNPALLTPSGVEQIARQGGDANILSDNSSTKLTKWSPRTIEFRVNSDSDTWVTVKQFYFPGWTAMLGSGQVLSLKPALTSGLMSVRVPGGNNDVRLVLPRGKPEILGSEISGVAGLLVAVMLGYSFKRLIPAE